MRCVARLACLATPALILPILIPVALRFGVGALPPRHDRRRHRHRHCHARHHGQRGGELDSDLRPDSAAFRGLGLGEYPPTVVVILAMNMVMLIVGGPLDLPPAILLLAPILVPLAQQIGLDLLQLGLIMVLNLGIGLYTPPVGTTLFISSSISGSSMSATVRELWPYFWVAIALLAAISYVPALTIRF